MRNKRYGILGMNCVTKDFLYLFEELNVVFIVPLEGENQDQFARGDIPVCDFAQAIKKREAFDQIILCGFDKTNGQKLLESIGFTYMQDYVFEEDFFTLLNEPPIDIKNREMVIWGTGKLAEKFYNQHPECGVAFYIDTNSEKKEFHGATVKRPSQIEDFKSFYVVIAVSHDEEIEMELESKGMLYGEDYIHISDYPLRLDELAREVFFEKDAYDFKCHTMLNHFEVGRNDTSCCCTTFIDYRLKSFYHHSLAEIWYSKLHKLLCLSTENQTYALCKKDMCPLFVGQQRQERSKLSLGVPYEVMLEYPSVLLLGFDASCNLYCETCRNSICFATGAEKKKIAEIGQKVCDEILPHTEFLIMAGNGETFASPAYKEVYESEAASTPTHIRILSNGMLFNQENWKKFKKGKTSKVMLTCSIDAATKETYETIRRGGNFDVLKKNMEFAASLREKGELSYFRLNFVVQRRNYQEMVKFVEWGLELQADEVFFTKILNYGTFSDEEFRHVSMMEEDGITPKKELQKILDLPIMQNRIVNMGTIQAALHKVPEREIYNYYEWELERKVPGLFL